MAEMPVMASLNYSSTTSSAADLMADMAVQQHSFRRLPPKPFNIGAAAALFDSALAGSAGPEPVIIGSPKKEIEMAVASRRLIQVFIADTDENVPLSDCLLYSGEQKLTDSTDQELFFEIDIKSILDTYNAKRVKLVNKSVKERTEHLEPIRIRDLKMTVVTIASF